MSQIISFKRRQRFAAIFDDLIQQSGYKNRSRFLRDAAIYFAEIQQKGDLMSIDDGEVVEGHLVNYYQTEKGAEVDGNTYRICRYVCVSSQRRAWSLMPFMRECSSRRRSMTDVRGIFEQLKNTRNVDKVVFVSAPLRQDECC